MEAMAKSKDNPITPPDGNYREQVAVSAVVALAERLERKGTSAIVKIGSLRYWKLLFPDPWDPRSVAKKNRAVLKDNAERLGEPLERLHGVLDDDGQTDLLAVMLACLHIGRIDDLHLKHQLVELEKVRESHAEQRKRGCELALKHAADVRKEHPRKFKSNLSMAEHITPQVNAEMRTLYPRYTVSVRTVRDWLAGK
jgi:hypothetical protein